MSTLEVRTKSLEVFFNILKHATVCPYYILLVPVSGANKQKLLHLVKIDNSIGTC